jgi:hypothetical protein
MTVAERSAVLGKVQKHGHIGITEAVREQLLAIVERGYVVTGEEYNGWRLTFHVNPRTNVSTRTRYELDGELYKYGNSPHELATDFTAYRLTFVANK